MAVILALSTSTTDHSATTGINDKVGHILAFILLGFLAQHAFPGRQKNLYLYAWLLVYGLSIELIQTFIPERMFSLLDLMAESGCKGLLIGFESLDRDNLSSVRKAVNVGADYGELLGKLRRRGIVVYGTFLLGLDGDGADSYREDLAFAVEQKLFMAAFNHVVPFPGTPLYDLLDENDRLVHERWWMSEDFRFGQSPFRPVGMTPEELELSCDRARREFYALPSILRRGTDLSANCGDPGMARLFFGVNLLMRREVSMKRGLPLGVQDGDD